MAYKPRWVESEETFVGSTDNMLYVGANGKLQETSKMRFDADSGNGRIYIGELGDAVQRLDIVADTAFSYSVTDTVTYVNSVSMDGASLTIQIADSPGNISQSNIELTRTGKATFSSQNDAGNQMIFTVDSGVSDTAFTFEAGSGNTEVRIDDSGITLATGPAINEISNDSASDSTSVLLTSSAVQEAISSSSSGLFTEDGSNNIIGGTGAGDSITSGSNNFIGGVDAGTTLSTGQNNVIIGHEAGNLHNNSSCVAIGYRALRYSATGQNNTCVGNQAGEGTSGFSFLNNTYIGAYAGDAVRGGSSNTAVGSSADGRNYNGNNNVSVGFQAGYGTATQSWSNCVSIGYRAGFSLGNGSDGCVLIGFEAGYNETNGNKLHIANNQTESLIEGDFSARTVTINGSLTVTDATSITLASLVLSDGGSGSLLVNGQEVGGGGGTTINNITNEGDSVSPFPQDIQNNSIHTLEEYLQAETIQYDEKFSVANYDTNGSGATKAVALKNGDFFIAYYDGSEGKYQIRKSDGTQVKAATTFETNTVNFLDLCLLPDGKVFLAYDDDSNDDTKYAIFDDQGNSLYSATWATNIYNYTTCAAFPNGNVLIAGANPGSEKGQYQILSIGSDGTASNVTAILDFTSSEAGEMRSTTMQNGNVLVFFENVSQSDAEFFISDSDGNIVIDVTEVDSNTPNSLDCCTLRNGHVFLFYYVDFSEALRYVTLDNEGNTLFSGTYASGTYLTDDQSVACTELPDGNVMVSYIDTSYDIFMAIIDEEANTILAESIITSTSNLALQDAELATSNNGSVFFGVTDVTGGESQNAKYTVFAGTGLKVNGDIEVTGSITASTLTVDASSVIIGATELTEKSGGGLLVNGQEVGGGSGVFTEDGSNNIVGGTGAAPSLSGSNNFIGGVDAANSMTGGTSHVVIGYQAAYLQTGALYNVYVGHEAGYRGGGNYNTYLGRRAGYNNTSGANNVVIGGLAAVGATSNNMANNTIVGYQAANVINGGDRNCVFGADAAQSIQGGSDNVFMGYQAGNSNANSDNNVVIGYQAGYTGAAYSDSVFIGYQAGYSETNSNKLHIANNQTESLIEGDFSARTAHVNGTFTAEKVEAFSGSVISTDSTAITNQVVLVNASGGAVTVDLIYEENAYIVVKKTDSSVNAVTIQGADGKTIDGSATQSLTTQYQAYTLFGFNGAWHII